MEWIVGGTLLVVFAVGFILYFTKPTREEQFRSYLTDLKSLASSISSEELSPLSRQSMAWATRDYASIFKDTDPTSNNWPYDFDYSVDRFNSTWDRFYVDPYIKEAFGEIQDEIIAESRRLEDEYEDSESEEILSSFDKLVSYENVLTMYAQKDNFADLFANAIVDSLFKEAREIDFFSDLFKHKAYRTLSDSLSSWYLEVARALKDLGFHEVLRKAFDTARSRIESSSASDETQEHQLLAVKYVFLSQLGALSDKEMNLIVNDPSGTLRYVHTAFLKHLSQGTPEMQKLVLSSATLKATENSEIRLKDIFRLHDGATVRKALQDATNESAILELALLPTSDVSMECLKSVMSSDASVETLREVTSKNARFRYLVLQEMQRAYNAKDLDRLGELLYAWKSADTSDSSWMGNFVFDLDPNVFIDAWRENSSYTSLSEINPNASAEVIVRFFCVLLSLPFRCRTAKHLDFVARIESKRVRVRDNDVLAMSAKAELTGSDNFDFKQTSEWTMDISLLKSLVAKRMVFEDSDGM